MAAAVVCAYPSMIYFVSHVEVVFESEHFWSIQLLWSTPLLFISILPGQLRLVPSVRLRSNQMDFGGYRRIP